MRESHQELIAPIPSPSPHPQTYNNCCQSPARLISIQFLNNKPYTWLKNQNNMQRHTWGRLSPPTPVRIHLAPHTHNIQQCLVLFSVSFECFFMQRDVNWNWNTCKVLPTSFWHWAAPWFLPCNSYFGDLAIPGHRDHPFSLWHLRSMPFWGCTSLFNLLPFAGAAYTSGLKWPSRNETLSVFVSCLNPLHGSREKCQSFPWPQRPCVISPRPPPLPLWSLAGLLCVQDPATPHLQVFSEACSDSAWIASPPWPFRGSAQAVIPGDSSPWSLTKCPHFMLSCGPAFTPRVTNFVLQVIALLAV